MGSLRLQFGLSALLLLSGCSGSGGGDTITDTGPDDAGPHTAANISVVSGGNQSVGPGQAVPTSPVVRVLSERGRPLRGAMLQLTPDAARGTLAAQSVVTGPTGEATLPLWTAPLTAGDFSVTVSTIGASGPVTTRVTARVEAAAQTIISQTLGASGGTIAINSPGSAANGLTITVPPSALGGPTAFSVSVRPAPTPPEGATLASPLFQLTGPTTLGDSIMLVRLPASEGSGGMLAAAMLASDGTLVPVTTLASDAGSVTIGLRNFPQAGAAVRGSALRAGTGLAHFDRISAFFLIRFILPTSGVHSAPFVPAVDAVGFKNEGSFWQPGGYCVGATLLSGMWWDRRFTPDATLPGGRAMFAPLLTNTQAGFWQYWNQLNPAVRLGTELQRNYGRDIWNKGGWKVVFGQSDISVWANVLLGIWLYKRPIYIGIRTAAFPFPGEGHALLAYRVDVDQGRIYVVDPNDPDTPRWIQWNNARGGFDPFPASLSAQTAQLNFTEFAEATWLIFEEAGNLRSIINDFRSTGLRERYLPWAASIRQANGQVTSVLGDATIMSVEARDQVLQLDFPTSESGVLHWFRLSDDGSEDRLASFRAPSDFVRIPLRIGVNTIGLVFEQDVSPGESRWIDAKTIKVTRAVPQIRFLTQPVSAQANQPLGPVNIGLVGEDDQLLERPQGLTLTLRGGAAGAVLSGTSTVVPELNFTQTYPDLRVNLAGTGYTLDASIPGFAPVTSAPFDVTASGGNGILSGRVYDATQGPQAGLAGVSILVRAGDGSQAGTTISNGNGDWSASGLAAGSYSIEATLSNWVTTTLAGQTLILPSTVVAPIPMVPANSPGGISGNIRDASTNGLITSVVTVELRNGMNVTTGTTVAVLTTATGTYSFSNVPAGVYTVTARTTGYVTGSRTGVVVGAGNTANQQDVHLSTTGAAARIVLTWGPTPRDLDSHLTGPTASGTRFWVYYASRGNCTASPFACLDTDQTNGNGPETITIAQPTVGVYRYYVYDFTNRNNTTSTGLGGSGAKVEFYVGGTLMRTFFVPSGAGNAWEVFEWDGFNLTAKNRLYGISGTPQPALMAPGTAGEQEFRELISRLPPKERRW